MDICTEGLPASELVAGVPVVVLKFLRQALLTVSTIRLPARLPTPLEAESLELKDQGSGGIVVEFGVLREETVGRHVARGLTLKIAVGMHCRMRVMH